MEDSSERSGGHVRNCASSTQLGRTRGCACGSVQSCTRADRRGLRDQARLQPRPAAHEGQGQVVCGAHCWSQSALGHV